MKYGALVLMVLLVGGCDLLDPKSCHHIALPALGVKLRDATTGAPLVADSVRVEVREGPYTHVEVVRTPPSDIGMAYEHTGTFEIRVGTPGYVPWDTSGVRVRRTEDGCHPATVSVTAYLVPE
jgi:hypothetical protein